MGFIIYDKGKEHTKKTIKLDFAYIKNVSLVKNVKVVDSSFNKIGDAVLRIEKSTIIADVTLFEECDTKDIKQVGILFKNDKNPDVPIEINGISIIM